MRKISNYADAKYGYGIGESKELGTYDQNRTTLRAIDDCMNREIDKTIVQKVSVVLYCNGMNRLAVIL